MKTLRITGVPEHFNLPWKKVIALQPFLEDDIQLKWVDESRGSGQMNKALRNDETDIAIVLTESFLQDFENGNPSKILGYHVISPLIWGVHCDGRCPVNSLQEIKTPNFLISRMGSGSQLMSYVLAKRENWDKETLGFKIVGNLPRALEAMHADSPDLFLWEKYTTKPWVDSGEMKRIGEVPSPWPCFVIVATDQALSEFGDKLFELRDLIYKESENLKNSNVAAQEIASKYDLKLKDVELWLQQTSWAINEEISTSQLKKAMIEMVELGILKSELRLKDFLAFERVSFLD
ncbi:ABC transporter substrate-binding protein [Algoriphagus aestuarii]|nr:ABC transporter substrate-binding protein [Algoriphagus aestuarii]